MKYFLTFILSLTAFFAKAQVSSSNALMIVKGYSFTQSNCFSQFPDGSWTNYFEPVYISWEQNLGVQVASNQLASSSYNWIFGKLDKPSGTSSQYLDGTGVLRSTPIATNGLTPNFTVGSVSASAYLSTPTVVDTVTSTTNHSLSFTIPIGGPGAMGSTGSTGATGADGALSIQRIRATSNASGVYSWTFGTPFGVGIIPIVTASAEGVASTPVNVQVVSVTRTNVVFQTFNLPSLSVVGILVLGAPTTPATTFDAMAIAP